jgi:hypothetical protein
MPLQFRQERFPPRLPHLVIEDNALDPMAPLTRPAHDTADHQIALPCAFEGT